MVQEFHISTCSLLVRCRFQAHSSSRGLHQFPHITTELVAAHDTVQQSPILQRMKSLNTLHVLRVHNICTYIYWQALLMSLWDPFYDFWLLFSVADKESKVTKMLWEGRHSCLKCSLLPPIALQQCLFYDTEHILTCVVAVWGHLFT